MVNIVQVLIHDKFTPIFIEISDKTVMPKIKKRTQYKEHVSINKPISTLYF